MSTGRAEIRVWKALLAAIAAKLARIMNLTTVAEGVETREQLTILRQLGCSSAQGFLWTKALPLEQLRRLRSRLDSRARL